MDLIEEYKKFGGDPAELEGKGPETQKSMLEMQKKLINAQRPAKKSFTENSEESLSDIQQKIAELKSVDTSQMDVNSDEYRDFQNRIIYEDNKARQKLGLNPKSYEILDRDLEAVLNLGAGQEYLDSLKDNRLLFQTVKRRIDDIRMNQEIEAEREEKRLNDLDRFSSELERLSRPPLLYRLDTDDNVVLNPDYKTWESDLLSLRNRIQKKINAEQSLENDESVDFQKDERTSIYKLSERVNALIEEYQINEE